MYEDRHVGTKDWQNKKCETVRMVKEKPWNRTSNRNAQIAKAELIVVRNHYVCVRMSERK